MKFKSGSISYFDKDSITEDLPYKKIWVKTDISPAAISRYHLKFNLIKDYYVVDCSENKIKIEKEILLNYEYLIYQGSTDNHKEFQHFGANTIYQSVYNKLCFQKATLIKSYKLYELFFFEFKFCLFTLKLVIYF